MKTTLAFNMPKQQQGMALFMSLVMLLIITVLGLSSVQTTSMQERMARNAKDTNLAFNAAESAIKDAEVIVESLNSLAPFTASNANANGYYTEAAYNQPSNWSLVNWQTVGGNFIQAATNFTGVAAQPKFIVEFVKTVVSDDDKLNLDNIGQDTGSGRAQIFRVTVYGTGGTATAHVMIQSTYGKVF